MGGNAGGSPSPSAASPGTSARRDRLLFPPLTVFLGHEMPPPAAPATGPAASPSEELVSFTNSHSPEGRAVASCLSQSLRSELPWVGQHRNVLGGGAPWLVAGV